MSSITELKARARQIREATIAGENTAVRVGSLFADIVDRLEDAGVDSSLTITPYLDSGVKIASFNQNGNIVSIYSPTGGGSGGGGSVIENPYDDTEIRGLIDALNNTLNATTALANSEKDRLDGVIEDIDNNVKDKMQDAIDFASWIQGNFPQGDITYKSGWDEKTKEYLQVVGLWDTDLVTTSTKWSYIRQNFDKIESAVISVSQGEDLTELLEAAITEGIREGTIEIDLETVYASKDAEDVLTWLYSALKNSTSSDKTFNQLVSAAQNSDTSGISEIRTLVEMQHNGSIISTANVATKVENAISELYLAASPGYSSTSIFSTVKQNSSDIATIVTEATNNATGATIAAKFANYRAGLVVKAGLTGAVSSLIAAGNNNDAAAAVVTMFNGASSSVKISADHISFNGNQIDAIVTHGIAINNGIPAGQGRLNYQITANSSDGFVIESRGGNADISIFNIDNIGNISHTYNSNETFAINREGDGHIASGHISWDTNGNVSIIGTYEETDELGYDTTLTGTASFTAYGFELQYEEDGDYLSTFQILKNGSIVQKIGTDNVFQSNYNGTGFLGAAENQNGTHPISWDEDTAQLFDLVTVTKSSTTGNFVYINTDNTYIDGLYSGEYNITVTREGANQDPAYYAGVSKYIKIGNYYFLFLNGILVHCGTTARTSLSGADDSDVNEALTGVVSTVQFASLQS